MHARRPNTRIDFSAVFIATIVLTAFLFTACFEKKEKHNTSSTPDATLTLALRSGIYADVIKKSTLDFEAKTNIRCNVVELSESDLYSSIIENAGSKGAHYDLCMVDSSWMAEYTSRKILTNLTELGYALDDDIIPATKSICYHDGNVYLAPYYGNVTVLMYNRLMIKEAGFTADKIDSLEDVLEICKFQKKRHNLGFMYRGDTPNNVVVDFLPILLSRGTWVVDENNNPTVNTYGFAQALSLYKTLIKTGRAAKKDDLIAAIANKSAAIGIGWPGWYTPTRNSSMDYIALSGKYRRDGTANNANIYGIWAIGVPANSVQKGRAVELLRFLMDKDVQKSTVFYGGVPCRYSSLTDNDILQKFPQYEAICKALEGGVYRPVMQEWTQFYTILGNKMKLIIEDKKPLFDGLEEAQKELEEMLAASRAK
ncbi:MAG: extracellular solute-binding protein [Treponema sp.]|nr:extracellular solute-binding protein [Treponema sp.]